MIRNERHISLETAELARKIGIGILELPTQSLFHKKLIELHFMYVSVKPEFYPDGINWLVQVLTYNPKGKTVDECYDNDKCTGSYGDNGEFNTHEDALEYGFQIGLKLLQKK